MAKIRITQVKSKNGKPERQKRTLEALGIHKLNHSVEHEATPQILGMVVKVRHLVKFKNINRKEYKGINISTLQYLAEQNNIEIIDFQAIVLAGLVSKNASVKILGKGTLEKKLVVHAHAFSKSAKEAIEAKNGTAVIL